MSADRQPLEADDGHDTVTKRPVIEPFPIRSPYACRTWPPGLADLSAPTATFPLHDVTDVFAEQPTLRDRSVLTASRLRQTHVPDSGLDTSLGRLPFPRRQVPKEWWSQTGSNRRPHACKARALPAELWPQRVKPAGGTSRVVVGLGRLERPTSPLSGVRSNHLSYRPSTIELSRDRTAG